MSRSRRRLASRVAAACFALGAVGAGAFWSADATRYVVAVDGAVAILDAQKGAVERAFPLGLDMTAEHPQLRPGPGGYHVTAAGRDVLLSRDGSRLVTAGYGAVHVWNVATGRLELRVPKAHAAALLGEHGEELAIVRPLDGPASEVAVWDVASGKPFFTRVFMDSGQAILVLPTDSPRFAAFAVGQRELWIWSRERRALERVELPEDLFIDPPLVASPDGSRLAVSGMSHRPGPSYEAAGQEVAVYDTRNWRPVQHYRVERGNPPAALGWTGGGEYLVASVRMGKDLLQFNAATGELKNRWHYTAPLRLQRRYVTPLGRGTSTVTGGQPLNTDGAVLSPAGDRLALVDNVWARVVAWDVTSSPPKLLPDLCETGQCGNAPTVLSFSPRGDALMVHDFEKTDIVVRVDLEPRKVTGLRVDFGAIERLVSALSVPRITPATCAWDPRACAAVAAGIESSCRRDARQPECAQRVGWLKTACGNGDRGSCDALRTAAGVSGERAAMRLGLVRYCAQLERREERLAPWQRERERKRERPEQRARREAAEHPCVEDAAAAITPAERASLRADCEAMSGICTFAARAAERAHDAKLAIALARTGCDSGHRDACLAGGDAARRAGHGAEAYAFYERACAMRDRDDCAVGLREASRLPGSPALAAKAPSPATEMPGLCRDIAYARVAAVPAYEKGEFVGVRVRHILGDRDGRWPFREGDLLLNSVRCDVEHCTAERFMSELNTLCRIPQDSLLHELRLEVRSVARERNRDLVLRRPAASR